MLRYFRHTGHSQQIMLTVSASSPDLADVHCLESIHIVSVISMWLWSAFIKGSVILCWLCVFIVLLYLLLENFQVKYFVPIKLHHLPLSPGCVRSCIFYSLLRVHNSFFSCYPLSFPLKKKTHNYKWQWISTINMSVIKAFDFWCHSSWSLVTQSNDCFTLTVSF